MFQFSMGANLPNVAFSCEKTGLVLSWFTVVSALN